MDCSKAGRLIRLLRMERGWTQKQLADSMNISDKTISKWERGLGMPDVSLLVELSALLGVNIQGILNGGIEQNDPEGGNMKRSKYYVCPVCGGIVMSTGNAEISCCGRQLAPLEARKADEDQRLNVEVIEDEWYITSAHPMTKDSYISFVAFATGERVQIVKQYPEWDMQLRIHKRGHGMLLWYSTVDGLMYQLI